jgi:hypothetical protein
MKSLCLPSAAVEILFPSRNLKLCHFLPVEVCRNDPFSLLQVCREIDFTPSQSPDRAGQHDFFSGYLINDRQKPSPGT